MWRRIVCMVAVLLMPPAGQAGAQGAGSADFDAAVILGDQIGRQLGDLAATYAEASRDKADMSRELAEARRAFWDAYPHGPGFEEAKERFARLLLEKDWFYLHLALAGEGAVARGNRGRLQPVMERIRDGIEAADALVGGGSVDGGIRDVVFVDFGKWVIAYAEAFNEAMDGELLNLLNPATVRTAMNGSAEEYRKYAELRDIAEFDAAGVPLPGTETPVGWVRALLRRTRVVGSWSEAETQSRAMFETLGEDRVADAVGTIREAMETERPLEDLGLVAGDRDSPPRPVPEGLTVAYSKHPYHALTALLGRRSGRDEYLVRLGRRYGWDGVLESYRNTVALHGEEAVVAAMGKVHAAPRDTWDHLAEPEALGVETNDPLEAVLEILRSGGGDRSGYYRTLMMQTVDPEARERLRVADPTERIRVADELFAEFVAEHGETAVRKAADQVDGMRGEDAYVAFRNLLGGGSNNPDFEAWRPWNVGAAAVWEIDRETSGAGSGRTTRRRTATVRENTSRMVRLHIETVRPAGPGAGGSPSEETLTIPAWRKPPGPIDCLEPVFGPTLRLGPDEGLTDAGETMVTVDGRDLPCRRATLERPGFRGEFLFSDAVPGRVVRAAFHQHGRLASEAKLVSFREGEPGAVRPAEAEPAEAEPAAIDDHFPGFSKPEFHKEVPDRLSYTRTTQPPRLLNGGKIEAAAAALHPPDLRRAGLGGTALVAFFVDEKGWTRAAEIMEGTDHDALDRIALELAEYLRFDPARNGDEPVGRWWFHRFEFEGQ